MSDNMKKVRSGDPVRIPATTFNSFIDAAQDFQQRQRNAGQVTRTISAGDEVLLVKNSSGGDCPRYGILGIDGVLHDPALHLDQFKNATVVIGATPTESTHGENFLVLLEPVRNGRIGRAKISGTTCVQIGVTSEGHTHATVKEGASDCLKSSDAGPAVILWKEAGTGLKWALVKLGGGSGGSASVFKVWMIIDGLVYGQGGESIHAYYRCREMTISADHFGKDNYDPFVEVAPGSEPFVVLNMSERGENSGRVLTPGDFLVGQEFTDTEGNTVRVGFSDAYAWIHE